MTQETFLNALKSLKGYRGGAAFYTWLYRIAVNCCMSGRRKLSARPRQAPAPEGYASPRFRNDPKDPRPGPDSEALSREREAAVQAAITSLSPEHRLVIVLHDIQGNEYDKVARILRCPRGTVKSRLHRARMALREKLKDLV